jgi:hypothetical protein
MMSDEPLTLSIISINQQMQTNASRHFEPAESAEGPDRIDKLSAAVFCGDGTDLWRAVSQRQTIAAHWPALRSPKICQAKQ